MISKTHTHDFPEMLMLLFTGQSNLHGITILPLVAAAYKTGARYNMMVKMMTIFHAFPPLGLADRDHNGSFGMAAGKSMKNLRRHTVSVKSIQKSS